MYFEFSAIPKYLPYFLPAAWMTLQVTTLGILLGFVLGLGTSFLRISDKKILNLPARAYIYLIRGTPLLLQLLFIYFGLRSLAGLEAITSAVLALGIHNGAYIAEIFRGAISSISTGQMEAARSLGMSYPRAMVRIILPQALKRAIPPLGNQFIIALKDSSLASTITINELLLKSQQLASSNFMMMEMLAIAALFYLLYTAVFSWLFHRLEAKLDTGS
ncbi:polar amino acid ABC transporter, inner membrane subunit [Oleidesulfovibrio alaskensis G20]|jgi:polar amino acid transport system permease protein|uniref:Putative glutamine transport system permease protein GlnP n=1 Tax=Oleidesulfovibrio alaskensis (strain ATCC BAA-1058 / DSM 17464 / G20) TaxID=207559 RepID=Q30UW0_OLEA2|nr:amino acid ABC transporter permease [Oleidesulfovibrio alaskensis]ABB40536.1 polar amino acid ABC transporter, inner membrane subunit [Oleidesulfovibrio alaskensis G20]MBG0774562.1 amino acid ABC transporter permease [Oleidesulfovibrio alaskensis]MBL3580994.1 amino acid ABC transporter permease [Oleidesulfovibrio alaskensis]MBL3588028.1 amino acid ABC transporter permease [bacterium]